MDTKFRLISVILLLKQNNTSVVQQFLPSMRVPLVLMVLQTEYMPSRLELRHSLVYQEKEGRAGLTRRKGTKLEMQDRQFAYEELPTELRTSWVLASAGEDCLNRIISKVL